MDHSSGIAVGEDGIPRCWWCGSDPLYVAYHDNEWGRPVAADNRLFEKLSLEGFQSGLSWLTILRKRDNFRRAFSGFDIEAVARFGDRDVERLLGDAGIVRHRGKIEATINNAARCAELIEETGSLASYAWAYEPPARPGSGTLTWAELETLEQPPQAVAMSKDLKRRGWKFVGPTTVYSFMESMGMVNDHVRGCSIREEVDRARSQFQRPV